MSKHPTYDDLLAMSEADPIGAAIAAREKFAAKNAGFNRQKYERAGSCFEFACQMKNDPRIFRMVNEEAMKGGRTYALNPEEHLANATMFIYGGFSGPIGERARSHAGSLEHVFPDKLDPRDVPNYIEEAGGLEKLLDKKRSVKQKKHGTDIDLTTEESDDDASDNSDVDDDYDRDEVDSDIGDEEASGTPSEGSSKGKSSAKTVSAGEYVRKGKPERVPLTRDQQLSRLKKLAWELNFLIVASDVELIRKVTGAPRGHEHSLVFKVVGGLPGWQEIVAVRLERGD